MPARGTGTDTFFWSTILVWGGGTFLAWGTQTMIRGEAGPRNTPSSWRRAYIVGLVAVVDIVSIVDFVGMVDVVGLVDMVSKYKRHSRQGRHIA